MKLVIEKFGASLRRNHNRFRLSYKKETQEEFSAEKVSQIIFMAPGLISSEAVKLAVKKDIDIVFLSYRGEPIARIYPFQLGGIATTRRAQYAAYSSEKSALLAKSFVKAKIANQKNLLEAIIKKISSKAFNLEEGFVVATKIDGLKGEDCNKVRSTLLGIEGACSAYYFSVLSRIFRFPNRNPKSRDIFNQALNYGYGILYAQVNRAIALAGLDPFLGYLHTERYGKPSLVLDLTEEFRAPVVDSVIIGLVKKKLFKNGLTREVRFHIAELVLERLENKTEYQGKAQMLDGIIQNQAYAVTRFLKDSSPIYKPFVQHDILVDL